MQKKYGLEIYEPGSRRNCWMFFESDTPFMAFHKGDIVNPGLWPGSEAPVKVLRVIGVEHFVWESDGFNKHKVAIYTEAVEGTEELRLSK